jgi:hypothetical protein
MAQTSYTDYLDQKFANPNSDSRTIVNRWDAVKTIDSYKIGVTFVKYSDGSYDVNYESWITQTGGGHMEVACSYSSDEEGNTIRCDYEAYKRQEIDPSSMMGTYDVSVPTSYDIRCMSGFFTLKPTI